ILKEIDVEDEGKKRHFREEVRIFTEDELVALGKKAGFKLKKTYGNYSLDEFNKEESERLILIFEK
ncbi:MAG: SAM-dependent methyltransferase, partial [Bacteroidia bacterium]